MKKIAFCQEYGIRFLKKEQNRRQIRCFVLQKSFSLKTFGQKRLQLNGKCGMINLVWGFVEQISDGTDLQRR
jgi:hypothetical protein